ncbi:MAG: cytochrome b/b6 domain-containing protein [Bacteroidota bacterium]|nr:cytochrome b/b6 domain-containing protein [Bacteroidota bacterium]
MNHTLVSVNAFWIRHMKKAEKKHPLAIRWLHWINFPILAVMVWSGLLIYWANDIYRMGWGDKTILRFFPDSFYKALNIPFRLAEGMSLHFVFMWIFAINGFIYVLFLIFSGEWRLIFPNSKSLKESLLVVLHDLHLRKSAPPQKKYNAAQRIAYTLVIFMGLGSVLTGISIYKPVQFRSLTSLFGGYEWARIEHFTLTLLFSLFFLVHILQVIFAGWNNFQSMVTGLFILPSEEEILIPSSVATQMDVNKNEPINEVQISENNSLNIDEIIPKKNNSVTDDPDKKINPDE